MFLHLFRNPFIHTFSSPLYRMYKLVHSVFVYISCRIMPENNVKDDDESIVLVEWTDEWANNEWIDEMDR